MPVKVPTSHGRELRSKACSRHQQRACELVRLVFCVPAASLYALMHHQMTELVSQIEALAAWAAFGSATNDQGPFVEQ
ncbi:hypothetical protein D3C75_914100 [compost metagenome]